MSDRNNSSNLEMPPDLLGICTAYESGFGHGVDDRRLANPYVPVSSAWFAYRYGYEQGKRRSQVETKARPPSVTLNGFQVRMVAKFIDGDEECCVEVANLPEQVNGGEMLAAGTYVWLTEYPEEGCLLLSEEPTAEGFCAEPKPAETSAPRFMKVDTDDGEVTVETCPRCAYPNNPEPKVGDEVSINFPLGLNQSQDGWRITEIRRPVYVFVESKDRGLLSLQPGQFTVKATDNPHGDLPVEQA